MMNNSTKTPSVPSMGAERGIGDQHAFYEPYKYYDPFVEGSY